MSTLTDDEMDRLRAELCEHLLDIGAEPYFSNMRVFALVQTYVTSSSTAATTSSSTATVGPTTITVASATGISQFDRLQIDCDDLRETVTVRSVSGSVLSVICRFAHSGTYPVEKESSLTLVRGVLHDLSRVESEINAVTGVGGLKQVDEVVWKDGPTPVRAVSEGRHMLRTRLAHLIGLSQLLATNAASGGGSTLEPY
jgi:hypothetical protein